MSSWSWWSPPLTTEPPPVWSRRRHRLLEGGQQRCVKTQSWWRSSNLRCGSTWVGQWMFRGDDGVPVWAASDQPVRQEVWNQRPGWTRCSQIARFTRKREQTQPECCGRSTRWCRSTGLTSEPSASPSSCWGRRWCWAGCPLQPRTEPPPLVWAPSWAEGRGPRGQRFCRDRGSAPPF